MARQAVHRKEKPQGIDNLWNEIKQRKLGLKNIKLTKSGAYIPGMYRSIRNGYSFFWYRQVSSRYARRYYNTALEDAWDAAFENTWSPPTAHSRLTHIFTHSQMRRLESGESKTAQVCFRRLMSSGHQDSSREWRHAKSWRRGAASMLKAQRREMRPLGLIEQGSTELRQRY